MIWCDLSFYTDFEKFLKLSFKISQTVFKKTDRFRASILKFLHDIDTISKVNNQCHSAVLLRELNGLTVWKFELNSFPNTI